jgi:hypothetical protein
LKDCNPVAQCENHLSGRSSGAADTRVYPNGTNVPRLSFQEVVHPVLIEEADVAEASDFEGEPDEHAQDLYALAEAVTKAAGVCLRPGSQMD